VALFSTISGLMYGSWVDGTSPMLLAAFLLGFLMLLAGGLYAINQRQSRIMQAIGTGRVR
jgi:hypothetical protein